MSTSGSSVSHTAFVDAWQYLAYLGNMTSARNDETGGDSPLSEDVLFGEAVATAMFRKKRSQKKVAASLGISQPTLSRKLHGERPWSLVEAIRVADVIGVDLRDLLPQMWTGPAGEMPIVSAGDSATVRHQGLEPRTR